MDKMGRGLGLLPIVAIAIAFYFGGGFGDSENSMFTFLSDSPVNETSDIDMCIEDYIHKSYDNESAERL